ncbi:MAG TPA: type I-U CRISPR-associated helicase/endonuclease Cas3 [Xanthobacteraceae bacterium]|nr:type I-U CRISPR-associated helicase/endonuclease Cas3 [Xanthobacteraceae bacterium]
MSRFDDSFSLLTGYSPPMRWQKRLFDLFVRAAIPAALDLPTGLGKTSVMAIWLVARALAGEDALKATPRRLVYIVDRRTVVDQATEEAEKLRDALDCNDTPQSRAEHLKGLQPSERERAFATLRALKGCLGFGDRERLPISTLRGAHVDNREWLDNPAALAIIIGTVDMIGSRLLFEGYGVSRKMRPYHAGLLGADTLIVLDEAHLVPPFADLLRAVESEGSLWPEDEASSWQADIAPRPPFAVLPLSATQRERPTENGDCEPFGLEREDWHDDTASPRLNARKHLRIEPLVEKDHDKQLAEAALELATKNRPARVVIFCNRREKKDDGGGPSAQGVAEAIKALADGDKKAGREKVDIHSPELLVGARRVREREQVASRLKGLGFIGRVASPEKPAFLVATSRVASPEKPAFLVATSAGEVGIDFDADHMVCDLAPWERMVQRLGRVNRRGGKDREAQVVVFDTSGIEKDEARKVRLSATRDLLSRIETDFGGNAGPATLLELRGRIGRDEIEKASTPEPLRPALTRALVDAWSMTSLEDHTGRPDVAPWLRGWVEPDNQTVLVWRTYLPVREGSVDWPRTPTEKKEVEAFFKAVPAHESEKLETETYRVVDWLQDRAKALLTLQQDVAGEQTVDAVIPAGTDGVDASEAAMQPAARQAAPLHSRDIVLFVLLPNGDYAARYTLGQLAAERKGKAKEDFVSGLVGKILIVDSRIGGLNDGVLTSKGGGGFPTADTDKGWSEDAGFRVRLAAPEEYESKENDWHFEDNFVLRANGDGDAEEWLVIEHYRSTAQSEDARSVSRPQELGQHESWAEQKAGDIASKIGFSGPAFDVLTLAARLHDEGKRAGKWQNAFNAKRDAARCGLTGPLAKTTGFRPNLLDGYRHEFGSLAVFETHHPWAKALPVDIRQRLEALRPSSEWFDLLQHLVASHHGGARPVISTDGCQDGPPSALKERACEVALRFAALQKRWGPWGLAWWEALLRAADQQASRDNDRGEGLASHGEGR